MEKKCNNIIFIHCSGTQLNDQGSTLLLRYLRHSLNPDIPIIHPGMPEPQSPSYKKWKQVIAGLEINEGSLIIGHSLGASVLVKYLAEEKPNTHVAGLFLIAAPFWGKDDEWKHGDYALSQDFSTSLATVENIFLYHSRKDETVPFHHLQEYQSSLGRAATRILNGYNHYFHEGLPELVNDLKKCCTYLV